MIFSKAKSNCHFQLRISFGLPTGFCNGVIMTASNSKLESLRILFGKNTTFLTENASRRYGKWLKFSWKFQMRFSFQIFKKIVEVKSKLK